MASKQVEKEIDDWVNNTTNFRSGVQLSRVRQISTTDIKYYDRLWKQKLKELETEETIDCTDICPD